jgi:hypothetical protein
VRSPAIKPTEWPDVTLWMPGIKRRIRRITSDDPRPPTSLLEEVALRGALISRHHEPSNGESRTIRKEVVEFITKIEQGSHVLVCAHNLGSFQLWPLTHFLGPLILRNSSFDRIGNCLSRAAGAL